MINLFFQCIRYSLIASIIVIGIIFFRLLVKNIPKWTKCFMWLLVGIRLLLPFSFESRISPVSNDNIVQNKIYNSILHTYNYADKSTRSIFFYFALIWIIGMAVMILLGIGSYIVLKHRLSTATIFDKGVKQSDCIDSSFVFGLINPMIYIPYNISSDYIKYILAHEKAHIARLDYIWKVFAFLLLCIYWYNPFMWIAYILLEKDIESACDEKVIRGLNDVERKMYSYALLGCSVKKGVIYSCPVAFGEVDVKERINNIMNYKKPKCLFLIFAFVFFLGGFVVFMTKQPKVEASNSIEEQQEVEDENVNTILTKDDTQANENVFDVDKAKEQISYIVNKDSNIEISKIRNYKFVGIENGDPVNEYVVQQLDVEIDDLTGEADVTVIYCHQ